MASFQVKDAYAVMNALARQATAQEDIAVVDHTTFIDAGTKTLATGTENVLNSIARTLAKIVVATRKYNSKFSQLIATDSNEFNGRVGKISYYAGDNEPTGAFNTDLYTNLADGYDNGTNGGASVGTMWDISLPKVLERFFLSEAAWDKHYTIPEVQLQSAFNNEADFVKFMNGRLTEVENDIESTLESFDRSLVADRIAGVYAKVNASTPTLGDECAVDMAKLFNYTCGTTYTRDEILQEHLTEFLEIWVAKIKLDSDRLEERTALYHNPYTITESGVDYNILRHSPKSMQKMYYASEFFTSAKARVLPEIFNPSYLNSDNGVGVTYWQSSKPEDRLKIKAKVPMGDGAAAETVELDYVLGIIFDRDALLRTNQFVGAFTSPLEARKMYRNVWYHWKYGTVNDYSENSIIYFLGNGGATETFTGDGSEVDFVIDGTVREILSVTVGGTETTAYTFDADTNTITFTTAPANDAEIVVWYK